MLQLQNQNVVIVIKAVMLIPIKSVNFTDKLHKLMWRDSYIFWEGLQILINFGLCNARYMKDTFSYASVKSVLQQRGWRVKNKNNLKQRGGKESQQDGANRISNGNKKRKKYVRICIDEFLQINYFTYLYFFKNTIYMISFESEEVPYWCVLQKICL